MRKIILGLTVLSLGFVSASQIESKQIKKVSKQNFLIEKIMPCDKKSLNVGNSIVNIKEVVSFISNENKDKVFTHNLKEGYENKYSVCQTKEGKYLLRVENITYEIKK